MANKSAPIFRYPENVGQPPVDKWILFQAKKGRHIIRSKAELVGDTTLASVALYLPEGALKSGINAGWEGQDVGSLLGAAIEAGGDVGEKILGTNFDAAGIKDTISALAAKAGHATEDAREGGILGMANLALDIGKAAFLEHFSREYGAAVGAATGHVLNPKTDMMFTSVQYRTHEFEFMLVPRNVREARVIDEIVKFFQYYMLPSFGQDGMANGTGQNLKLSSFMIGFPHEFEIQMRHSDVAASGEFQLSHINRIGRSVLKSCMVDHAAAGKVSFIKDDGEYYPTATKLSLTFDEVRLLGRDSKEIERPGTTKLADKTDKV